MTTLTKNKMKWLAICRIAGHILTIVMHLRVVIVSGQKMEEKLPNHRELDICVIMGPRYLTMWNVMLQIFYAFYATICDLALLFNVEFLIPSPIRHFRHILFSSIVLPNAWGIFLSFWPVYYYDRALVYPVRSDLVLTKFDNFIAHSYIAVYTMYEVMFLPKDKIRHSSKNVLLIVIYLTIYIVQMLYTRFVDVGVWPYDMLTVTEANILNPLYQANGICCTFVGYFLQFKIRDFMWGSETMDSTCHVCCRIAGHVTMLYFLTIPLLDMNDLIEKHSAINPDVKMFAALRTRFATLWNVGFQLFYASLALLIDVYSLRGMESKIPAALRNYRYTFYAGIIFPVVCGVQMFWIVYFYDKELVFKQTLEVVISQKVNFIVHTLVSIYALWELVFLPRDQPKKNDASWMHVFLFNVLYVAVIFYTRYVDIGVWTYEVQTLTVGSIMFLVILFSIWTLSTIGYYFQFHLKDFVWWCRDGFSIKKKVF